MTAAIATAAEYRFPPSKTMKQLLLPLEVNEEVRIVGRSRPSIAAHACEIARLSGYRFSVRNDGDGVIVRRVS